MMGGVIQKTIGFLLVVGATSAGGIGAANRIRNQYEQLRYLQKLICLLRSELQYARSYLGEAFRQIGSSVEAPYKEWLLAMCEEMENRSGGTFAQIWEEKGRECLGDCGLPKEVLERLLGFGSQLGNADTQTQVMALNLWQSEIELSMEETREGMRTKIRLYHCLGIMSGIFITVLLL